MSIKRSYELLQRSGNRIMCIMGEMYGLHPEPRHTQKGFVGSDLVTEVARYPRITTRQRRVYKVVVHITGRSTWNNAEKYHQDPLTRLENYFTWINYGGKPKRGVRKPAVAQYAICPWGRIMQYCSETVIPWAQGYPMSKRKIRSQLMSGKLETPRWWHDEWENVESPLDLLAPGAKSPNYGSVAIECVQYGNQYLLTTAQYKSLSKLIQDICFRWSIPKIQKNVYGHEDCVPWMNIRSDKHGGWDPGARRAIPRFSWDAVEDMWWEYECEDIDKDLQDLITEGMAIETPEVPEWLGI